MSTQDTIDVFAGLIKKPPLNDQLLSRPPFKFILDIVSNVIKSTGYLKSEFSKDDLEEANKDKNSKVAFLDKLIRTLDSGDLTNVKSAKIIAGKNPEETNKLLLKLGTNAREFSSGGNGDVKEKKKSRSTSKDKEKTSSKSESSERKSKKDSTTTSDKKEKRDKSKDKKEKASEDKKKSSSSKERHKSKDKKSKDDDSKKEKKEKKEKVLRRDDSMIAINGDDPITPNNVEEHDGPDDEGYDDHEEPSSNVMIINGNSSPQLPRSSHSMQGVSSPVKTDDSGMGDESPRPPPPAERAAMLRQATGAARPQTSMGRPGTASSRPAPPKIKKKQIATIDSTPQPVIELKSEIISETSDVAQKRDIDDNFVMEEDEIEEARVDESELIAEEDRGALVQKIMETRAELEDGGVTKATGDNETDRAMTVEREKVALLQKNLQELTKSAYPLARLFDFANDDIELMIKELEKWRLDQRKIEQEDQNKKASGFGDSGRLYDMISNLQTDIRDMKDELSAARGRVLANDERIKQLVSNI